MIRVRRIDGPEPALLGFLAPLAEDTATEYWRRVLGRLEDGVALWVAEDGEQVVGSVQLESCSKENGRHRAEVQKLFVLHSHRGRGISTRLMREVEAEARAEGRTLLVLDTLSHSDAASVYRHLGWQYAGSIPEYAATPDGVLHATAYFYKQLK